MVLKLLPQKGFEHVHHSVAAHVIQPQICSWTNRRNLLKIPVVMFGMNWVYMFCVAGVKPGVARTIFLTKYFISRGRLQNYSSIHTHQSRIYPGESCPPNGHVLPVQVCTCYFLYKPLLCHLFAQTGVCARACVCVHET